MRAQTRADRATRRRRGQRRGATVFLVTLVMTMLVGLGVFAARATSLSGRAAGYLRQGEQTHYLMQHGMALALNEIDRGATVYGKRNPNSSVINQSCSSTVNYPGVQIPCVKFTTDPTGSGSFDAMVKRAQQAGGKTIKPAIAPPTVNDPDDVSQSVAGSLGPWRLLPSMYVEMTDFSELDRPPPGTAVSGNGSQFRYRQATLVSWGQVGPFPTNGPTASCSDVSEKGAALVVSREAGRGQIVFGPID